MSRFHINITLLKSGGKDTFPLSSFTSVVRAPDTTTVQVSASCLPSPCSHTILEFKTKDVIPLLLSHHFAP